MRNLVDDIPKRSRFKVGMVGGGKGAFFASYHRAAMRLCNRFNIVAGVFSSDPLTCREAGEAFDLAPDRIYTSFAEMAEREVAREDRIDVGVIVTPNHLHFEPCRLFLERGIPVICDKPLVNDLDEARALVRLAERKGVFFAVTYTYCGYPMVRDARARIRAGEIGDVRFMYVEYLLEWGADDLSKLGAKGGIWRDDPRKAGATGSIGDVGTHAFNILEFLSGRRCTELSARLSRIVPGRVLDDTGILQLNFEGGIEGLLWTSQAAPGHRNGLRFKIIGSNGSLEWSQEAPETLKLGRLGQSDLIYRRGQSDMMPEAAAIVSLPAGNSEGYLEALGVLYADFATGLEAGPTWRTSVATPIPDVVEGMRGVALSEASIRSDARRGWVSFPNG
jgi:predicted dehydrogenase